MANRLYAKDHEYIQLEGDVGTIGISDYAQQQLGDVVFVELPEVGKDKCRTTDALSKRAQNRGINNHRKTPALVPLTGVTAH